MILNEKQKETEKKIERIVQVFNEFDPTKAIDISWSQAIALQESSLGINQLSPTGAKGVYGLTRIVMLDLINEMVKKDDELIDIACGNLFLRLLFQRWKTIEAATLHYCDPKDRGFYLDNILNYMAYFDNP